MPALVGAISFGPRLIETTVIPPTYALLRLTTPFVHHLLLFQTPVDTVHSTQHTVHLTKSLIPCQSRLSRQRCVVPRGSRHRQTRRHTDTCALERNTHVQVIRPHTNSCTDTTIQIHRNVSEYTGPSTLVLPKAGVAATTAVVLLRHQTCPIVAAGQMFVLSPSPSDPQYSRRRLDLILLPTRLEP